MTFDHEKFGFFLAVCHKSSLDPDRGIWNIPGNTFLPISALFWGKNVFTSMTQSWLSVLLLYYPGGCLLPWWERKQAPIQYFIIDRTKSKMKHNLPFWKTDRKGLNKISTLLYHLPVTAGTEKKKTLQFKLL